MLNTFTFYIVGETHVGDKNKDGTYILPEPEWVESYISSCLHIDQYSQYYAFLNKETAERVIKSKDGVRPLFEITIDGVNTSTLKGCVKMVGNLKGDPVECHRIRLNDVQNLKLIQARLDHVDPVKYPKPFTELTSLRQSVELSLMPARWHTALAEFEKERKKQEDLQAPKVEPKKKFTPASEKKKLEPKKEEKAPRRSTSREYDSSSENESSTEEQFTKKSAKKHKGS
jgi:hypothetical protein